MFDWRLSCEQDVVPFSVDLWPCQCHIVDEEVDMSKCSFDDVAYIRVSVMRPFLKKLSMLYVMRSTNFQISLPSQSWFLLQGV